MTALVSDTDVEAALLRPLTDSEQLYIDTYLAQASARLRQRMRNIDARIAAFAADPADPFGVDPVLVSAVLAGVIKRFMDNPEGASSLTTSDTAGPFSKTRTASFAGAGRAVGASLIITAADLAELLPAQVKPRSIRLRPALAPGQL